MTSSLNCMILFGFSLAFSRISFIILPSLPAQYGLGQLLLVCLAFVVFVFILLSIADRTCRILLRWRVINWDLMTSSLKCMILFCILVSFHSLLFYQHVFTFCILLILVLVSHSLSSMPLCTFVCASCTLSYAMHEFLVFVFIFVCRTKLLFLL